MLLFSCVSIPRVLHVNACAVIPSEFGVPRPWYFLCTPSYWRCGSAKRRGRNADGTRQPLIEMEEQSVNRDDDDFDALPDHEDGDHAVIEEISPALRQLQAGQSAALGCPLCTLFPRTC